MEVVHCVHDHWVPGTQGYIQMVVSLHVGARG